MILGVMIDTETMSTQPNAVVCTVGAVQMRMDTLEVLPETAKHWTLNWEDQIRRGHVMDASTVRWWLGQERAAQSALLQLELGPTNNAEILREVAQYVPYDAGVWSNGADFDCVLMQQLFKSYDIKGWKYKQHRCFRTIKSLYGHKIIRAKRDTYHNALDDAVAQAKDLMAMLRAAAGNTQGQLL